MPMILLYLKKLKIKNMKKILLGFLLLVSIMSFGQVKREQIIDEKIGKINFKYIKIINIEKNEVSYLVYLGFQNEKYKSITDTKSIGFFDKESLNEFNKDLNTVKTQMLLKEKVSISWNRSLYNLTLYDFSFALYLENVKGVKGYTTLNVDEVNKLIENISKIDFGKDGLLVETN